MSLLGWPIRCGPIRRGISRRRAAGRLLSSRPVAAKNPRGNPTFEQQVADTMIIAGTPDQVIERLKYLVKETRPGIMGIWANDGTVSKEDRRRCIQLLFGEVMPAIKEYGAGLGLKDPWEANAPVHLRYSTDIPAQKVAAE